MSSLLLFERTQNLADANAIKVELSEEFEQAKLDHALFSDLIDLGLTYKRRGYIDVFLEIFQELFQINPRRERISFLLAETYYYYGDMNHAEYFISYCNKRRTSYRSSILEVKILMANEKNELARTKLNHIIKQFNEDFQKAEPYYLMAQLVAQTQGLIEAETYLNILYKYFYNDKAIDLRQVRRSLVQIEFEKEIYHLDKIEALYQDQFISLDSEDYLLLAEAYKKGRQFKQALKYADQAFQLDHDNWDAKLLMIEMSIILNKHESVLQDLAWLIDNLPYGDSHYYQLIILASEVNQLDEKLVRQALDLIELGLENDQIMKLMQLIVKYELKQGRAAHALSILNNVAAEFEAPEYFSYLYAITFRCLGDEIEALAYYYDALELSIESDTILEEVVALHKQRKEFDKALAIALQYQMSMYYTDKVSKQIETIPIHYKK